MPDTLIAAERPAVRLSGSAVSGGSTISLVSLNMKRIDGNASVYNATLYLSDSPVGAGLTAVTASGVVVAGASGIILGADLVTKKAFTVQTTAAGLFILSITDAARTPFVVCVVIEGRTYPVITLATANYG